MSAARPWIIHPLLNGRCAVNGRDAFEDGDPGRICPYALYLWLLIGGDHPVLVDSGLGNVEEMNRGAAGVLARPIVQSPSERTVNRLAHHGIRPEQIGTVVLTHLHFDHVDELHRFTNARIIVSGRGLAEATRHPQWKGSWAPGKVLEGLTRTWADRVVAKDDVDLLPGLRTFWIGGHTPCSQAVAVETAQGHAVIAGDTVSLWENIEKDIPVGVAMRPEQVRPAMARIRKEADIVLPSHDPRVITRFPHGIGVRP